MRSLPSLMIALLLLAACAAPAPAATPSGPDAEEWRLVIVGGEPGDAGISVAEAFEHGPTDDIVAVTGFLFVDADGAVLLCEMMLESFPPQCGGERIVVDGLDLSTIADLQEANGMRWAEGVTLLGSVE